MTHEISVDQNCVIESDEESVTECDSAVDVTVLEDENASLCNQLDQLSNDYACLQPEKESSERTLQLQMNSHQIPLRRLSCSSLITCDETPAAVSSLGHLSEEYLEDRDYRGAFEALKKQVARSQTNWLQENESLRQNLKNSQLALSKSLDENRQLRQLLHQQEHSLYQHHITLSQQNSFTVPHRRHSLPNGSTFSSQPETRMKSVGNSPPPKFHQIDPTTRTRHPTQSSSARPLSLAESLVQSMHSVVQAWWENHSKDDSSTDSEDEQNKALLNMLLRQQQAQESNYSCDLDILEEVPPVLKLSLTASYGRTESERSLKGIGYITKKKPWWAKALGKRLTNTLSSWK